MKRTVKWIGVCALGLAVGGLPPCARADDAARGEDAPAASATEPKLETLLRAQLEGVEGTEVIVSRVTLPPNTTLPKHWHPGEEFAYVLEGSLSFWLEGAELRLLRPGDVAEVPLRKVHTVTSGDEGATALVFRVHEEGQPERVPVE